MMNKQLLDKMSQDMNIVQFSDESPESFYQRLMYSAGVEWMKTLAYGESYADIGQVKKFVGVDVGYISTHLFDVLEVLLSIMGTDENWFGELGISNAKKASKLTNRIIQDVIYSYNMAEINSRRIVPLEQGIYKYGNTICLLRGSVPFDEHIYNVGPAKWVFCEQKEKKFKLDERIINISGQCYYDILNIEAAWQYRTLSSKYLIFKLGSNGKYSKCWIPCPVENIPYNLSILKLDDKYNGGYFLTKKSEKIEEIYVASLDSWYIESKEYYRILYALNYHNGTPAEFKVKKHNDYHELYLSSALPDYENRLLINCSWPLRSYNDQYGRIIPNFLWDIVESALTFLGIKISYY